MRKFILILNIIILTICSNTSYAQDNMLFLLRNTPQKSLINPALTPKDKFYISLPILGGININANSNLSLNSVYRFNGNDAYLDKDLMIKNIKDNNNLNTTISLDILNLGFKISNNGNLNFAIRTIVKGGIDYNKDLFSFLIDNPIERNRDFNIKILPCINSWEEVSVGYSHTIKKQFSVGMRAKFLLGIASAQSSGNALQIRKDFDNYYVSGNINFLTGNLYLNNDAKFDFSNSPGYALDFGFAYKSLDDKIKAHASISDLGKIFWGASSSNIISKHPNKEYKWSGVDDIESLINGGKNLGDQIDDMFNSIKETIGIDTVSMAYSASLPYHIQFGGSYSFDSKLKHTISLNTSIDSYQYLKAYSQVTLGYTYSSPNNKWDLIASYTYKTQNAFNIGFGALYRGKCFEIFLISDSVNSLFSVKSIKSANLKLGINFYKALTSHR